MDHRRESGFSGSHVVQIVPEGYGHGGNENWAPDSTDQAVWATEDEYGMWSREVSADANPNFSYDGRLPVSGLGSEPPNKRSRDSRSGDLMVSDRSRAIGKMFYKTKLCCKFRAGTCPYVTNCNFAHNIEELRKPPPNWQEIVAAHEEDREKSSDRREEFQIPILGDSDDASRSYKGRHCKKFFTEEGCPYGENCTFLHDEHSRTRESVAISLGPGSGGGYGGSGSSSTLKPSNWKTRMCNKWELTGYCPFGSKCHFAHGVEELHRYGGGTEVKDPSAGVADQGALPAKASADAVIGLGNSLPHSDGYNVGVPPQRLTGVMHNAGPRSTKKWKGPDKISKIYGDWIDDL